MYSQLVSLSNCIKGIPGPIGQVGEAGQNGRRVSM